MTVLTKPARPEQDTGRLRPVPWRRMIWVTWRQHRMALLGVAVFVGAIAAGMWVVGVGVHHDFAVAAACHPASSMACRNLNGYANGRVSLLTNAYPLLPIPALIGAFTGVPMLAREMETGTFRYTWTQAFGRWRWTVAKLASVAVVVSAEAGALTVFFYWYYHPYLTSQQSFNDRSPLGVLFPLLGVALAAWTLAAFAIGALAGMLIRRVVPAIAATLTVYTGLALAAGLYLRHHYLPPVVSKWYASANATIVGVHWTKGGQPVSLSVITQLFQKSPGAGQYVGINPVTTAGLPANLVSYFSHLGYTQWISYQPTSRFWPFQLIEGGWLLALAVLLIAATLWLVRRRAA